MDESRIERLRQEVLAHLGAAPAPPPRGDLEDRVEALEAAVRRIEGPTGGADVTLVAARVHPSLRVLPTVPGGSDRCVLEPEEPCTKSGRCRALGH